ncbi:hypothetical protein MRB53_012511 [Persea americana]|uniref:Uncharacterized protein n=1 Tax=Persea americana TaxID=3435 RepID=A0ACC2LXS0_PERAE|nr:hypothetical protein MRB53_012511 [Persea americana]
MERERRGERVMEVAGEKSSGQEKERHQRETTSPERINCGRDSHLNQLLSLFGRTYINVMLAVVGVVNFGYFQLCAWLYKYHNLEKEDTDSGSPSSSR